MNDERRGLIRELRLILGSHEFTRDRVGAPGCTVREIAAGRCVTLEKAIAILEGGYVCGRATGCVCEAADLIQAEKHKACPYRAPNP